MIKQGNSKGYPEMIVVSNGFFQCRYNITSSTKEDIDGSERLLHSYDYVEVRELSENLILDALTENGCKESSETVMKSIMEYREKNGILGNVDEEIERILSLS